MLVRHLGHLEAAVMDRLWTWNRPALVREVLEDLQHERDIAYTTVMTVMENLHRKGVLGRERAGRAYRYAPTQSREEYTAAAMEEVLASATDRPAALLQFVQHIDGEELAALRAMLDDLSEDGPEPS
jgi:predicted transcriptional regulator